MKDLATMRELSTKLVWKPIAHAMPSRVSFREAMRLNFSILAPVFKTMSEYTMSYQTDICYDIVSLIETATRIDAEISAGKLDYGDEYPLGFFGIRNTGVDGAVFINSRLSNPLGIREYAEIYMLTIQHAKDDCIQRLYMAKK